MTHDRDGAIADAFGVEAVPRLFMVDRAGRLAYVHSGYSEDALPRIVAKVNDLLREPPGAPATLASEAAVAAPPAVTGEANVPTAGSSHP